MKYFVCSDIHNACTLWKSALSEKGFDINNPDHKIILCGDAFDRLEETVETYKFIKELLDKNKLIYIAGNHEYLMYDLTIRHFPYMNDYSNGTYKSLLDLYKSLGKDSEFDAYTFVNDLLKDLMDNMVTYYETKNYIFVHGWLPLKPDINDEDRFIDNWREASSLKWAEAAWGNGFYLNRFNKTNKTVVFGHWHCSEGHFLKQLKDSENNQDKKYEVLRNSKSLLYGDKANFDPFYGENYIGIDQCVAISKKINIIIIEDEEDIKSNNKVERIKGGYYN